MKYRVSKEVNTQTKEPRFIPQHLFFGFWVDCQVRKGIIRTRAVFKKKKKADKFISDRVYCNSWKKEY